MTTTFNPEVVEECAKYGEVGKVIIYEMSLADKHINSPYNIHTFLLNL